MNPPLVRILSELLVLQSQTVHLQKRFKEFTGLIGKTAKWGEKIVSEKVN
jgi:hypothetical protein